MSKCSLVVSALWLLLHSAISQTTDKYADEDRPYKFGFNIQGYQHRQEEKDERGIIMGEYGFITADGYYRVTVYATDENGDFRIISMKNYYVGFPPEDPTTTPGPSSGNGGRAGSRALLGDAPGGNFPGTFGPSFEDRKSPKSFTRPQGIAACSDCSIPTTTPKSSRIFGTQTGGRFDQRTPITKQGALVRTGQGSLSDGSPVQDRLGDARPEQGFPEGRSLEQGPPGIGNHGPQSLSIPTDFGQRGRSLLEPGGPGPRPRFPTGPNFDPIDQPGDSPERRPQIGEVRDGLPPGVTLKDIKDLLYTFNYTVGFHGHHEDGYRNGDKVGDYFFDGRDGVERKVEYLANEFGFQPNITLTELAEGNERRPKEDTEKDYGLKGYEFRWFYSR